MLKQRLITALILAPIVLFCVFKLQADGFSWFVGFIVVLAAWEWANLTGYQAPAQRLAFAACFCGLLFLASSIESYWILLAAMVWWMVATLLVLSYPNTANIWQSRFVKTVIGVLILVPLWKAFVFIRSATILPFPDLNPLWLILYMLLLVWAADIGAYFSGKAWGNKKLAPNVSPGKSWAGAWGGLGTSILLGVVASVLLNGSFSFMFQLVLISIFCAAISIVGDLTESMFKRQRGIKDSSGLLPGHGGVMDRIDSLAAAVPIFVFLSYSQGWLA